MAKSITQDFLQFSQIKDGILVLKNKGLRAVLMVSSLNFELKSEDEQNAILYQFQNFLNSLDFSCQIIIHSRRLNMAGYLDRLKEIEKNERNELLKIQINEYQKFIESIVGEGTIMQKNFYVVVPFSLMEIPAKSLSETGKKITKIINELTEEEFKRARTQLLQRAEFVALGLRSSGLQSVLLNTMEVSELFWSLHHPTESEQGYYPEIPPELTS
ncbi:MAG: hypothetical protein PHI53_02495 [Candidatus Pacebacteria bacterium]|nr:hypothetical protein [Candidatus Paceibacterota bacterium]